jgi:hypothetical protein
VAPLLPHVYGQSRVTIETDQASNPQPGRCALKGKKGSPLKTEEWSENDEVALAFKSEKDFRQALEHVFREDIDYVPVGEMTIIIPAVNLRLFKYLKPDISRVVPASELLADEAGSAELAQLRRENFGLSDENDS